MTVYIQAGYGFDVGVNFDRAKNDIPVEIASDEFAKPGYTIGYIKGDPNSPLGFMRGERVRVHVLKSALKMTVSA